jgi:hypothetical protein
MNKTTMVVLGAMLVVSLGKIAHDKLNNDNTSNPNNIEFMKTMSIANNTDNTNNPNTGVSEHTSTIPTTNSPEEVKKPQIEQQPKVLKQGETIGYFIDIDLGDYRHFNIMDLHGKTQSFIIRSNANPKIDFNAYESNPNYRGKKVKVKWQETETSLSEGGGSAKNFELLDVEEVK